MRGNARWVSPRSVFHGKKKEKKKVPWKTVSCEINIFIYKEKSPMENCKL
jgi:hypothetical protein